MDPVSTFYISQGVLGVSVLVLGFVVRSLYNDTKRLEGEKVQYLIASKTEAVETAKEVMTVLRDNSQNIAILTEKIEVSKQSGKGK